MWQLKNLQHVIQNFLGAEGVWNGTSPNLTRIYCLSSLQDAELKDPVLLYEDRDISPKGNHMQSSLRRSVLSPRDLQNHRLTEEPTWLALPPIGNTFCRQWAWKWYRMSKGSLVVLAPAALIKCHKWGGFNNKHLFLAVLEAGKSEMQVPGNCLCTGGPFWLQAATI